ncbi:hypothetical protein FE782_28525 [Paenibacillus antri]|uniref:GerAB/ArcD/ProY family transporter n=1 Tax=Paenibacillus antri TaxID=2582848 RepID=A0A5R9FXQ4_9BACL|nr:hypothetical protein [Paenibacillus antri]TLS48807.1 hypothetical protein FE782_28525 [Paenibacillus antri]
MNRYFYYPILVCMLINTIIYVPELLIKSRFEGAITAMLIAIPLGSFLAYLFSRGMNRFPGLGISEIFEQHMPKFIRLPIIVFLGLLWFAAGSIALVAISLIAIRFINPDVSVTVLLFVFITVGCWAATRSSLAILYILEIGLLMSTPIIALIWFKAFQNEMFDWNAVFAMSDYVFGLPSWSTFFTATDLFTGYISLVVFNRFIKAGKKITHLWILPVAGTIVFFTIFFIPIGIHGTQAVDHYVNVWVSTADSLRLKYGFIERVGFLYSYVYIGLSLLFIATSWHVGTELMRSVFRKQSDLLKWVIAGTIGVGTFLYGIYSNEKQLIHFAQQWFGILFVVELLLVALVVFLSRRNRHA